MIYLRAPSGVCGLASEVCDPHSFCSCPFLGNEPPAGQQLFYLHNECVPSLGDMVSFAKAPRKYEDVILQATSDIGPSQMPDIFWNLASHPSSQYISVIEPSPTSRREPVVDIASRRIFELLWEKHVKQPRVREMGYLYNSFRRDPLTAIAAGWIFESRICTPIAHEEAKDTAVPDLWPPHGSELRL